MRRVRAALMYLIVRRPLPVGIAATLLAMGIGVALAMPGVTWRGGAVPAEEAAVTVERAFSLDGPRPVPAPAGPVADFALTDHEGRRVRFREGAGRVRLVHFVTTRCTTSCAQVTRELRGLQQALGQRMGRDVAFLTIGVDPQRDTAAALWKFTRRHGAGATGWSFLSGTAEELAAARAAFGAELIRVPYGHGHSGDDIEHTITTYLVDRGGVVRKKITPGFLTLTGLQEVETVLASSR